MPEPRTHNSVLNDIREHHERHRHAFDGLTACCFIGGAVDIALMDAHERYASCGTNGGVRCDVTEGPCACGGWH